jgi:hypothetical protein
MKFLIKLILVLVFIIIIVPALILGYLGFIPTISSVFGSDKPRDLGVTYTEADRKNAYDKNGVEVVAITPVSSAPKDSLNFEGKKEVNFSITGGEISALVNTEKWKYKPINNVQVKINPDGTGEASGVLNIGRVLPFISLTHSTAEVESAIQKYHIGFNPPYYVKGRVEVVNNKVTLTPEKIEIGRITVPQNLISKNLDTLTSFIEDQIKFVPNLYVRSLKLENGVAKIDATYPEKQLSAQY